jgi:hypothetical protein
MSVSVAVTISIEQTWRFTKEDAMSKYSQIKTKVKNNSEVVDLFSTADLIKCWEKTTGGEIAQALGQTARTAANYASTVLDVHVAAKLIKDLGVAGRVILKTVNGKQYVIFKGFAGTRSIFTSVRYLADNPKVVDMAIGKVGVNGSIMGGARLTIFLVVPLNVLNYILSDKQTMTELIGTTATDLAKVGITTAITTMAATLTAKVTTIAAGPIVVAIGVGLATGFALDALDQKFGLTEALVKALDDAYETVGDAYDSATEEVGHQLYQVERRLKWQIFNGQPVGEGIFY